MGIQMVDVHDKRTRSKNMSAIRNKNTKPEVWLRKQLFSKGFRYRLNVKNLPGSPDIVFPQFRTVIFFNGCFWHAHDCYLFRLPSTRSNFWRDKLLGNKDRDAINIKKLCMLGWKVIVVWECSIKGKGKLDHEALFTSIAHAIRVKGGEGIAEFRGANRD